MALKKRRSKNASRNTLPKQGRHSFFYQSFILYFLLAVVDYWTPLPKSISGNATSASSWSVDMLINPLHLEQVTSYLNCSGVDYSVAIGNVQDAIEQENVKSDVEDEEVLVGRPGKTPFCPLFCCCYTPSNTLT